jgi:hypothetical protein
MMIVIRTLYTLSVPMVIVIKTVYALSVPMVRIHLKNPKLR